MISFWSGNFRKHPNRVSGRSFPGPKVSEKMRALIAGCRSFYLYLSALVSAAILAYPRLLDKFSLSLTWSLKACAFHQPNKRAEGPMQDSSATGGENPEILNRELLGSRLKHIENSVKPWMDKVFQWKGKPAFSMNFTAVLLTFSF